MNLKFPASCLNNRTSVPSRTSFEAAIFFAQVLLVSQSVFCIESIPGGEIKRDPEIGKTAMQPEPAQTADLSISGSRLISSLCTCATRTLYLDGTQAISPHFRSRRTMTKNDTGHHPGVESGGSGLICDSEVARPPLQTV